MSEPTRGDLVLGTLNQICAGVLVAFALNDLYFAMFGAGWSDSQQANIFFYNLSVLHPWFHTMLWLRAACGLLIGFGFLLGGFALKHALDWAGAACVLSAALLVVFASGNLTYCLLWLNPASERALFSSFGSIPEGFERSGRDLSAILGSVPFLIYAVTLLVLMTLRRR